MSWFSDAVAGVRGAIESVGRSLGLGRSERKTPPPPPEKKPRKPRERKKPEPRDAKTRAEYDNERAKAAGFKSYKQFREVADSKVYKTYLRTFADGMGTSPQAAGRLGSGYVEAFNKYMVNQKTGKVKKISRMSMGPNGDFANFLVSVGLRDEDADWNVGETP